MARKAIDCPTCGAHLEYERVADLEHFPFCSKSCQMVDLDKWLEGDYRIPREITEEDYVEGDAFDCGVDDSEKP